MPRQRPVGAKSVLPQGTRRLIEAARQAEDMGIAVDEAWGLVLGVMRGEIYGRYVGERMRAAAFIIEQKIGKARQRLEIDDKRQDQHVYRAKFADGSDVLPTSTEELPN